MRLINGDCLEALPKLPSRSIHLTVTSPPYDDLRAYCPLPFGKFKELATELARVTKPGGCIVWIVADSTVNGSESGTSLKQALFFMHLGLNLHDTMIWNKKMAPFQHKNRYISAFEYMFIFSKGKPKWVHLIKDRKNKHCGRWIHGTERLRSGKTKPLSAIQKNKTVRKWGARLNLWEIHPVKDRRITGHPAMFPYELAFDHVRTWCNRGHVVLDPFLGSGTVGVACKDLGRKFIGIEKERPYFQIAKRRIRAA